MWAQMMWAQIESLAEASQNFGFLLPYEPLLVFYGAGAEAHVYADPNASLVKSRQFGEVLATRMVAEAGLRVRSRHQADRIRALADAGLLDPRIRKAFERIRRTGNDAVHSHYAEVRAALTLVRHCFELGVWFYRFMTGDRAVLVFVPPPEPDPAARPALSERDAAELEALRRELAAHRDRLYESKLNLDGHRTPLEAEQAAQAEVTAALARALADAEALRAVVTSMNSRIAALFPDFDPGSGAGRPAAGPAAARLTHPAESR